MQPVTIKNNQWTHSLWWVQLALIGISVLVLVAVLSGGSGWLLCSWPCLLLGLWRNHKIIKQQQAGEYRWTAAGKRFYRDPQSSNNANGFNNGFNVVAWWPIPGLLLLRLQHNQGGHDCYLTVIRNRMGAANFSNLWLHLSAATEQPNTRT